MDCMCLKSDMGWDENCPIHGLAASAASETGKRPDAAPPKEGEDMPEEIIEIGEDGVVRPKGTKSTVLRNPIPEGPDAAPPKGIFLQGGEGVDLISDRYWCQDRIDEADIRYVLAPPPSDAAPVACEKPLLMTGDAEYLRGLSVGGSHLVSAKWLCDFAQRIENTLAVMK